MTTQKATPPKTKKKKWIPFFCHQGKEDGYSVMTREKSLEGYFRDVVTKKPLEKEVMNDHFRELRKLDCEFWKLVYGENPSTLIYWATVDFPSLHKNGPKKKRYQNLRKIDLSGIRKVKALQEKVKKNTYSDKDHQKFEEIVGQISQSTLDHDGPHTLWNHVLVTLKKDKRPNQLPIRDFRAYKEKILQKNSEINDVRNILINANLRLALQFARYMDRANYGTSKIWRADLIQYSNLGLIEAVNRYDPDNGSTFSTYAQHWLRASMFRGHDNTGRTIRMPTGAIKTLKKIRNVQDRYKLLHNRMPTDEEILNNVEDLPPETLKNLQNSAIWMTKSLQAPLTSSERSYGGDAVETTYLDSVEGVVPPQDEILYGKLWVQRLQELLADKDLLSPRERHYITLHYGFDAEDPPTMTEMGKREGITRERVRQVIARGLAKIRVKLWEYKQEDQEDTVLDVMDTMNGRLEEKQW